LYFNEASLRRTLHLKFLEYITLDNRVVK